MGESEVRSTAETETLTTYDEDFSRTQRKIQRIVQEDLKKLKRSKDQEIKKIKEAKDKLKIEKSFFNAEIFRLEEELSTSQATNNDLQNQNKNLRSLNLRFRKENEVLMLSKKETENEISKLKVTVKRLKIERNEMDEMTEKLKKDSQEKSNIVGDKEDEIKLLNRTVLDTDT